MIYKIRTLIEENNNDRTNKTSSKADQRHLLDV